jgi:hypothetical protein
MVNQGPAQRHAAGCARFSASGRQAAFQGHWALDYRSPANFEEAAWHACPSLHRTWGTPRNWSASATGLQQHNLLPILAVGPMKRFIPRGVHDP